MIYQGQPAFTQFSSSNGGYSSAGSQPYLVAQPDPYEASSDNPNDPGPPPSRAPRSRRRGPRSARLVSLSFTRDGLGRLRRPGHLGDAHRQPGGLPTSVKVTGDDFRFRLGLKSTWFELAPA